MNTTNINWWTNEATRLAWKYLDSQSIEEFEFKRACFEVSIDDIESPLLRELIQTSEIHWEEILENII